MMKTLDTYISESILASSGAGEAKVLDNYRKYGLNPKYVKTNKDGTIDYKGYIYWHDLAMDKMPFKFNKVYGDFNVENCSLTTLEGAPVICLNSFNCRGNNLTSLKHCPKEVGGDFNCSYNNLTSIDTMPEKIGLGVNFSNNQIKKLEHLPSTLNGSLICVRNNLTSLEGCPKTIGGNLTMSFNSITDLKHQQIDVGGYVSFVNNKPRLALSDLKAVIRAHKSIYC